MIEIIGRPFVIICAFLAVLALLISSGVSIIGNNVQIDNAQNQANHSRLSSVFSTEELVNITNNYKLLQPLVVPISSFTVGSYWNTNLNGNAQTDTGPITFLDSPTNVLVYYTHEFPTATYHPYYLTFHQEWGGFLGLGISHAEIKLDKDTVVAHQVANGTSYINIDLQKGYTVIIKPDAGTNLNLTWGTGSQFNVSVGQTKLNATLITSGDALQIISQIMTFSVPNVGGFVNLILAAVLIPTYLIILFFVIRSLIPLLGG